MSLFNNGFRNIYSYPFLTTCPVVEIISILRPLLNGPSRCFPRSSRCVPVTTSSLCDPVGVPQEAAANRVRRTPDEAKTSCLLHLTADHRYFNKFKSVEAVVAQVTFTHLLVLLCKVNRLTWLLYFFSRYTTLI